MEGEKWCCRKHYGHFKQDTTVIHKCNRSENKKKAIYFKNSSAMPCNPMQVALYEQINTLLLAAAY